jgi:hypothetical protein
LSQWSLNTSADFDKTARKIDRAVLRWSLAEVLPCP